MCKIVCVCVCVREGAFGLHVHAELLENMCLCKHLCALRFCKMRVEKNIKVETAWTCLKELMVDSLRNISRRCRSFTCSTSCTLETAVERDRNDENKTIGRSNDASAYGHAHLYFSLS